VGVSRKKGGFSFGHLFLAITKISNMTCSLNMQIKEKINSIKWSPFAQLYQKLGH